MVIIDGWQLFSCIACCEMHTLVKQLHFKSLQHTTAESKVNNKITYFNLYLTLAFTAVQNLSVIHT